MGLSDPFDTTYAGSMKAGLSLGEGIGSAAGDVAGVMAKNNKLARTNKMLKDFGIIKEEDIPPSDDELKLGLQEQAKKMGVNQLSFMESDDPQETRKSIENAYKVYNLPMPQGKKNVTFDAKRASELGMDLDASTGDLKFNPSKNLLAQLGLMGMTPEKIASQGMEVTGYDQKGQPMIRKIKEEKVPSGVQTLKIKMLQDLKNTQEVNKVQRDKIAQADSALEKIPSGFMGKMDILAKKNFDPNNPVLGEWQKVKQVLTDDTLLNTARTKGAISDQEMKLFKESAANDDLASKPAVKVVLDKLRKFIDAEEKAKVDSYKESFGDQTNNSTESKVDYKSKYGLD